VHRWFIVLALVIGGLPRLLAVLPVSADGGHPAPPPQAHHPSGNPAPGPGSHPTGAAQSAPPNSTAPQAGGQPAHAEQSASVPRDSAADRTVPAAAPPRTSEQPAQAHSLEAPQQASAAAGDQGAADRRVAATPSAQATERDGAADPAPAAKNAAAPKAREASTGNDTEAPTTRQSQTEPAGTTASAGQGDGPAAQTSASTASAPVASTAPSHNTQGTGPLSSVVQPSFLPATSAALDLSVPAGAQSASLPAPADTTPAELTTAQPASAVPQSSGETATPDSAATGAESATLVQDSAFPRVLAPSRAVSERDPVVASTTATADTPSSTSVAGSLAGPELATAEWLADPPASSHDAVAQAPVAASSRAAAPAPRFTGPPPVGATGPGGSLLPRQGFGGLTALAAALLLLAPLLLPVRVVRPAGHRPPSPVYAPPVPPG